MLIKLKTTKNEEIVDITNQINEAVKDIKEGSVLVFVKHTTAAVTINENDDPKICDDFFNFMNKLIPNGNWGHDKSGRCDRNNGDAHLKSSLIGHSKLIPVENGKLALGKWQSLWFCEFDGPREREIIIQKNAL
ncbi:MAG: secondary thiamine-phosphate synthase enzyme YjbQ [Nanoarchaeota archaeon]|nr:secondary thiamine-phosphate synthase enzyme YjbQ [Nanoarchaeota archaeon]MBU0963241.1 secondary thiamine-phosphate synthase enzyme YjbQ [Nanoarchaeota archaeon]